MFRPVRRYLTTDPWRFDEERRVFSSPMRAASRCCPEKESELVCGAGVRAVLCTVPGTAEKGVVSWVPCLCIRDVRSLVSVYWRTSERRESETGRSR